MFHRCTRLCALLLIAFVGAAWAQQGPREFGQGSPGNVEQLPPGQLKQALKSLPPKARGRAMGWLQGFSFPEADIDTLRVDSEGGVFYEEPPLLEAVISTDGNAASSGALQATLDNALQLHSKPNATYELYIDFNGENVEGTAWNVSYSVSEWNAKAFDTDGDPTTFSDAERAVIAEVWHRVAEDYAPFDIDVTTELPSGDKVWGHALVTWRQDENGVYLPGSSVNTPAIAYVGVFSLDESDPNPYAYYKPAFVYADKYGFDAQLIAEAVAHEFGHNLSLSHDGSATSGGATVDAYYLGHGTGDTDWAPIMGAGYYSNVTQFTDGSYTVKPNSDANDPQYCPNCALPNNSQDDLSEISTHLGFSADDHGDTIAAATLMEVGPTGEILVSNPEWDAFNAYPANKGVINSANDADVFRFEAAAGAASFQVNPAWDAWYREDLRGANLDVHLELLDANGSVLATHDPQDLTEATVSATLSAGTHYLVVSGTGSSVGEYSDYNSQGVYYLFGSITSANTDTTPPTPSPMGWAVEPVLQSGLPDAVTMQAVTATDASSSPVLYSFECSGGAGCRDSGWQAGTTWNLGNLERDTTFTFQVKARDAVGNETALSVARSVTTLPLPPGMPMGLTVTALSNDDVDLSWSDSSDSETGYRIERQVQGASNWDVVTTTAANVTSYRDVGVQASTAYTYRLFAVNAGGDSLPSTPVTDTTKAACTASKTLQPNQWYNIGLPCNTFPDNIVDDVFWSIDPDASVYVWRQDPLLAGPDDIVRLVSGDEVGEGVGYWVKITSASAKTLTINGHPNSHADRNLVGDATNGDWNMVGLYRNVGSSWAVAEIVDGNRTYDPDGADPFEIGRAHV